jgi:hypothetical protein
MGECADFRERSILHAPAQHVGLHRKQLQHLAFQRAIAVSHVSEVRAIERRPARRERRRVDERSDAVPKVRPIGGFGRKLHHV